MTENLDGCAFDAVEALTARERKILELFPSAVRTITDGRTDFGRAGHRPPNSLGPISQFDRSRRRGENMLGVGRRVSLLLMVALTAAVVLGCGGEMTWPDYQATMQAWLKSTAVINDQANVVSTLIENSYYPSRATPQEKQALSDTASWLDTKLDQLKSVNPPGSASEAHKKLVSGFSMYCDAFHALVRGVEKQSRKDIDQAKALIAAARPELVGATEALNSLGVGM
jgi:hypothetical protein